MPARRILISNEDEACPESLEVKIYSVISYCLSALVVLTKSYGASGMTNAVGSPKRSCFGLQKCKVKILDGISVILASYFFLGPGKLVETPTGTAAKNI
jgi:hypothetical protein